MSKRKIPKADYPEIKRRYEANVPVLEIAKDYHVSRAGIYSVLRSMGVRSKYRPDFAKPYTQHPKDTRSRLLERQKPQSVQATVPPKLTDPYATLRAKLGPVVVEQRVMPSVPQPTVEQMSSRNGRGRRPALKLRFPPLPGEPGYVYRAARA